MSNTERLYYADSYLSEFSATVTCVTDRVSGWAAVTLDRTAFYPTGGGQPSDTGTLGDATVVECIDKGDDGVIHMIRGEAPEVGTTIIGRVDTARRLDHIQQHTGQHILSQAFVQLFQAPTNGFRMMEHWSEVDIELPDPSDVKVERAINLANEIVWNNRPLKVLNVSAEEAAELSLRKESARTGELRLIEIDGFDLTPCGGTHARRTGEVGIIALRHWSRAKGMTRIEFVAGKRAGQDYDRVNAVAREAAALFSVGRDDVPQAVARLLGDQKDLLKRLRSAEELAARIEAADLIEAAPMASSGARVISQIFPDRDAERLKSLAHALIAQPAVVALLGTHEPDGARLVFARSADMTTDMNLLLRNACATLGGRGGGRPDFAQGGGPDHDSLGAAIESAFSAVIARST